MLPCGCLAQTRRMSSQESSRAASPSVAVSRRRLLQALASGGALGTLGAGWPAAAAQAAPMARTGTPPELRGPHFELILGESRVDFDGRTGRATTVNGSLPGPTLRMREGETVTIRVTNDLRETASISMPYPVT